MFQYVNEYVLRHRSGGVVVELNGETLRFFESVSEAKEWIEHHTSYESENTTHVVNEIYPY